MAQEIFKFSNHLGFNNPYYFVDCNEKIYTGQGIGNILNKYNGPLSINPTAITSIFNKNFIMGDQTIFNEIMRSPWMGYPNERNKKWLFHKLPPHLNHKVSEKNIAQRLFTLVCEEIKLYVTNKTRIGILLSGGMDSRILAGCLNYLTTTGKIKTDEIVAYTWGLEGSRDVEYARRLAEKLGWRWKHFVVNADSFWENILIAGERGCEYSGMHLHAMPAIANDNSVDVVLAGSYGDSVGRAEYQGRKVSQLIPIDAKLRNAGHLVHKKAFKNSVKEIKAEVERYHQLFPRSRSLERNELDYQLHYMRRMLNPCMEVINDKIPLFQIFTDPKVFGFTWSLDVSKRTDNIYYHFLQHFPKFIAEMPWARTGKPFGKNNYKADLLSKKHHRYEEIIQEELLDRIEDHIRQNKEYLFHINLNSVLLLIKEIRKYPRNNFDYLEKICWIASYVHFIKKYEPLITIPETTETITINPLKVRAEYFIYSRGRQLKKAFGK